MPTETADVAALEAEIARLKWYENSMRRLWFFFAGIIPDEWVDETIARLMKRADGRRGSVKT